MRATARPSHRGRDGAGRDRRGQRNDDDDEEDRSQEADTRVEELPVIGMCDKQHHRAPSGWAGTKPNATRPVCRWNCSMVSWPTAPDSFG